MATQDHSLAHLQFPYKHLFTFFPFLFRHSITITRIKIHSCQVQHFLRIFVLKYRFFFFQLCHIITVKPETQCYVCDIWVYVSVCIFSPSRMFYGVTTFLCVLHCCWFLFLFQGCYGLYSIRARKNKYLQCALSLEIFNLSSPQGCYGLVGNSVGFETIQVVWLATRGWTLWWMRRLTVPGLSGLFLSCGTCLGYFSVLENSISFPIIQHRSFLLTKIFSVKYYFFAIFLRRPYEVLRRPQVVFNVVQTPHFKALFSSSLLLQNITLFTLFCY